MYTPQYKLGEWLFTIKDDKIISFRVEGIALHISEGEYSDSPHDVIEYYKANGALGNFLGTKCSRTKEELINIF